MEKKNLESKELKNEQKNDSKNESKNLKSNSKIDTKAKKKNEVHFKQDEFEVQKNFISSALQKIIFLCEDIKKIEGDKTELLELRKNLKEHYEVKDDKIIEIISYVKDRLPANSTKKTEQIDKINEKIKALCLLVNISFYEKNSSDINYSKIRARVSNIKHNLEKKKAIS